MVGAILTQNTNWLNTKRAIENLKQAGILNPHLILKRRRILPRLIRPAGYYQLKSQRLINFVRYLIQQYRGSITRMRQRPLFMLRKELLALPGIGPETADSILLYALNKRIFVIDAYTRRILSRHNLISGDEDYDQLRIRCEENLPKRISIYKELHAQLVMIGKTFCRRNDPHCSDCPIADLRGLS